MDDHIKKLYLNREIKVKEIYNEISHYIDEEIKYFEYDIKWILFDAFDNNFVYTIKDRIRDRYIRKRRLVKGELPIIKDKTLFIGELFYPHFNTLKWQKKQKGDIALPYKEKTNVRLSMDKKRIDVILNSFFTKRVADDIMDKILYYANIRWNILCNLGGSFEEFVAKNSIEKIMLTHDRRKEYLLFVDICRRMGIKTIVYQHGLTPYKEYLPMSDLSYYPLYADYIIVWGRSSKEYFTDKGLDENRIVIGGNFKWHKYINMERNPIYNVYIQQQMVGLKQWENAIENILKGAIINKKEWASKERGYGIKIDVKRINGDIGEAIAVGRCGITPFSSGALDFYFAGVPIIILTPFNEDPCGLKEVFPSASSSNELIDKLKDPIYPNRKKVEGLFGKPIHHKELQEIIYKI